MRIRIKQLLFFLLLIACAFAAPGQKQSEPEYSSPNIWCFSGPTDKDPYNCFYNEKVDVQRFDSVYKAGRRFIPYCPLYDPPNTEPECGTSSKDSMYCLYTKWAIAERRFDSICRTAPKNFLIKYKLENTDSVKRVIDKNCLLNLPPKFSPNVYSWHAIYYYKLYIEFKKMNLVLLSYLFGDKDTSTDRKQKK